MPELWYVRLIGVCCGQWWWWWWWYSILIVWEGRPKVSILGRSGGLVCRSSSSRYHHHGYFYYYHRLLRFLLLRGHFYSYLRCPLPATTGISSMDVPLRCSRPKTSCTTLRLQRSSSTTIPPSPAVVAVSPCCPTLSCPQPARSLEP